MDATAKLLIERACERLSIDYARHLDFHEYDAFVDLFTDNGYLDAGKAFQGKEAIRAAMRKRPDSLRSMHVLTNIHISVTSEDRASGVTYLTLFRHTGPESLESGPVEFHEPAAVGHYVDQYERTAAGFRIARRELRFAFKNSNRF